LLSRLVWPPARHIALARCNVLRPRTPRGGRSRVLRDSADSER
jgi:hypothetical protein